MFPYGQLDKKIEWGKLADLVSWDKAKENYAKQVVKNGHPAHTARIALAALTIKKLCPPIYTANYERASRTAQGHLQAVGYIAALQI